MFKRVIFKVTIMQIEMSLELEPDNYNFPYASFYRSVVKHIDQLHAFLNTICLILRSVQTIV